MPSKDPDYTRKWREAQKNGKVAIYAILEPETRRIRYVGSSLNVRERMRLHWSQREQRKTPLAIWLRSLDAMPDHQVLQEVCKESRWDAEEYWTRLLMQFTYLDLLNVHPGAKSIGSPRSEETRRKLSESQRKRPVTSWKPVYGEASGAAKLTEENVREIRQSSESLRKLAVKYGVSRGAIHYIRTGKTWTHVK